MIGRREADLCALMYSARRPSMLIDERSAEDFQRLQQLARRESLRYHHWPRPRSPATCPRPRPSLRLSRRPSSHRRHARIGRAADTPFSRASQATHHAHATRSPSPPRRPDGRPAATPDRQRSHRSRPATRLASARDAAGAGEEAVSESRFDLATASRTTLANRRPENLFRGLCHDARAITIPRSARLKIARQPATIRT